jgi:hypothetical protein
MCETKAKYIRKNSIGKTFIPMKKLKYHNVKTIIDGITFDSKKEAAYYNTIKLLKRAGEVTQIDLQPEFPYNMYCTVPGINDGNRVFAKQYKYIADFRVTYKDGRVEIIDVKGVKTSIYRQKKKIVEAIYNVKIIEK